MFLIQGLEKLEKVEVVENHAHIEGPMIEEVVEFLTWEQFVYQGRTLLHGDYMQNAV